ncbi:MAG: Plug domain-containing protein [Halioglobus sp.]|nr:Plug domain-containing protein [Halioglobus sp.]
MTPISGDQLRERGIVDVAELTKGVPSLQINEGHGQPDLYAVVSASAPASRASIRTVGVYLDDLFLPRTDGQLLNAVDVSSIQVLRGPQGALSARRRRRRPGADPGETPRGASRATLRPGWANSGRRSLRAAVERPAQRQLFHAAQAVDIDKDDGLMEDRFRDRPYNSTDRQSLLFQTRYEVADNFTLDALAYIGRIREDHNATNCDVASDNGLFAEALSRCGRGTPTPLNPKPTTRTTATPTPVATTRSVTWRSTLGPNTRLNKDLDTYLLGVTARWELTSGAFAQAGSRSA